MKIWFPTVRAGSGSDIYTVRLSNSLREIGIDTKISWFNQKYEFAPYLLKNVLPPRGTDIIHANSWSGFAFKRQNIPLVITEHHCVLDPLYSIYKNPLQTIYHNLFIKRFEQASLSSADAVVSVSNYTAESIVRAFGSLKSTVIYNYVDTEIFKPLESYNCQDRRCFKLLNVGNISTRKGIDILSDLMRRLGSDYCLYVTGGLRSSTKLEQIENVIITGQLTEDKLVEFYQQCDALIFPSRLEGFGYAAVEAMACGKPVICANNSALPEIVINGKTGYLCHPNDVDCYVRACKKLRNNPELRLEMGARSRERAVQMFNGDRSIPKYAELYRSLLASRKNLV